MVKFDKKYSGYLDKIDRYIAKFADSVVFSSISVSRYYSFGKAILRVSDHIGNNSDGIFHIIVKPNGYIIHHPNSGTVNFVSYEQAKEFVRVFMLFPRPIGPFASISNISEPLVEDEERLEKAERNNYILGIHKKHLSEGQLSAVNSIVGKIIHSNRGK